MSHSKLHGLWHQFRKRINGTSLEHLDRGGKQHVAHGKSLEKCLVQSRHMVHSPCLSLLLLRLPLSESSVPFSFLVMSRLSVLSCRLRGLDSPSEEGRKSGVFLAEDMGLPYCFGGVKLFVSVECGRLMLVNPALTAVKPPQPPELMGVKPEVGAGADVGVGASLMAISRSCSCLTGFRAKLACNDSVAFRAGESPRRLDGVLTVDRFMGLGAGLGVNGPPYSNSSC